MLVKGSYAHDFVFREILHGELYFRSSSNRIIRILSPIFLTVNIKTIDLQIFGGAIIY